MACAITGGEKRKGAGEGRKMAADEWDPVAREWEQRAGVGTARQANAGRSAELGRCLARAEQSRNGPPSSGPRAGRRERRRREGWLGRQQVERGRKKGAGRGKRERGPSGQNEREEVFRLFMFPNPFSFLNSKQIQI